MKQFDIVEFKREGPVSFVLGGLLKLFTPSWDFWGWHLAIAWKRDEDKKGWWLLESTGPGVGLNLHSDVELLEKTRCYTWLTAIDLVKIENFYTEHLGKSYDVAVYFWTAIQYLVRHFWNRRIPRLLDDHYTCWELVSEFCDEMGKPVESKYDCPMLPDILRSLNSVTLL